MQLLRRRLKPCNAYQHGDSQMSYDELLWPSSNKTKISCGRSRKQTKWWYWEILLEKNIDPKDWKHWYNVLHRYVWSTKVVNALSQKKDIRWRRGRCACSRAFLWGFRPPFLSLLSTHSRRAKNGYLWRNWKQHCCRIPSSNVFLGKFKPSKQHKYMDAINLDRHLVMMKIWIGVHFHWALETEGKWIFNCCSEYAMRSFRRCDQLFFCVFSFKERNNKKTEFLIICL